MKLRGFAMVVAAIALTRLAGAQDEKIVSGPQPAVPGQPPSKLPHSFEAHTFNGLHAERFHCLVCENDVNPTVLLFLKDSEAKEGSPLALLFTKLDELIEKYQAMEKYPEVTTIAAYAVFMSNAAQTSLIRPKEDDPAALVKEATDRRALYQRMRGQAKGVKKVVVACVPPEGPKGYKLNPDADLTGVFYDSYNVLENFTFATLREENIPPILERIERRLQEKIAALEAAKKKRKLKKS